MTKMPGKSYSGQLPPLTKTQQKLKKELIYDIEYLSEKIGERNIWNYKNLQASADFIKKSLTDSGYQVRRQNYTVENKECSNLETEILGTVNPKKIVLVGAHYDSVYGSPGANDNASGVAALLALARKFSQKQLPCTLRFLFFVNEEPPFFQTKQMGSLVYAKSCRANNDDIKAAICFDVLGYYTQKPNSQQYPFPFQYFYPSTGNFIGFVGNMSSRGLVKKAVSAFRENCKFPSEGAAVPGFIAGADWSDHWSFWQNDYPAILVTDTAIYRYPYYHTVEDTKDEIDYDKLARIVDGLQTVILEFTKE